MADWRDRLLPASFSGVEFRVRETEDSGGRRATVHTYPLRERPFVEELGAEPRSFRVDGYLVGDDYATRRELLRAAFDGASPGFPDVAGRVLVLPDFGEIKALCLRYTFRTASSEGRIVRFSAAFTEVGEALEPAQGPNPIGGADAAAEDLGEGADARFQDEVEVDGVVEEARSTIASTVQDATRQLRRLDIFSGPTREVRALEDALTQLESTIAELVTSPATFGGACRNLVSQVLASAPTPRAALEAYRTLLGLVPEVPVGTSSQDAVVAANSAAVVLLFRTLAIAGAVQAAARMDWETLDDAQETRLELSEDLDEIEEDAPLEVLEQLTALRAALGQAVPPADRILPRLRPLTLRTTLPALVVAFQLYQDPERGDEIVRRNRLPNPLRVPGFEELSVLTI